MDPFSEYYFPRCVVCGGTQVKGAVCLSPECQKRSRDKLLSTQEHVKRVIEEGGHFWVPCQICDSLIQADALAYGSVCTCFECWKRGGALLEYSAPGPVAVKCLSSGENSDVAE